MERAEVLLSVRGWPPAKNEAKSLLASGHTHGERVKDLLRAAREATGEAASTVVFGSRPIGLELTVESPAEPLIDATNFLGGVGDVLEAKSRRGPLEHLGDLAQVGLYENDRQIHEVRYRWQKAPGVHYFVRLWELTD